MIFLLSSFVPKYVPETVRRRVGAEYETSWMDVTHHHLGANNASVSEDTASRLVRAAFGDGQWTTLDPRDAEYNRQCARSLSTHGALNDFPLSRSLQVASCVSLPLAAAQTDGRRPRLGGSCLARKSDACRPPARRCRPLGAVRLDERFACSADSIQRPRT